MKKQHEFNLQYLLATVRKYRWYLAGVIGFAALLAIVLTMPFIYPPEYRASTVIYPTNAERFDGVGLFDEEPTIYLYGDAKGVERLKVITESEEIMLSLLDSLDLWTAYGIDPETDESPKFYAARIFKSYVKATRIEGNGLEIEAYDTDPERSAAIVNLMVAEVDRINREMLNENKALILNMYRESRTRVERRLFAYTDSMSRLRQRYNVFDNRAMTEVLLERVLDAQTDLAQAKSAYESGGGGLARRNFERAQGKLDILVDPEAGGPVNLRSFQQGLDRIEALYQLTLKMGEDMRNLDTKIEYIELMNTVPYSTILPVEPALPPDRKARPVRWIILLTTVLVVGMASLAAVVLVDALTQRRMERESTRDKVREEHPV